ncbi:MAG: HlyD family secretion protein [Geminicoccaceae bacterium]
MAELEARAAGRMPSTSPDVAWSPDRVASTSPATSARHRLALLYTLAARALALMLGWVTWQVYIDGPWTRDGTVRADVVAVVPEVSGNIVTLAVGDNQLVHKGDLLLRIDPTNYENAVRQSEAVLRQAQANRQNVDAQVLVQEAQIAASAAQVKQAETALVFARQQAVRYQTLRERNAGSVQTAQLYDSQLKQQEAAVASAQAGLVQAQRRIDLLEAERAQVEAGMAQAAARHDQARTDLGRSTISIVDADSFWVDAYFEETSFARIRAGDPATIRLMGFDEAIPGHVDSVARAISVANAQPNGQGVATVNPLFTWVRLAQRIPVRIRLDRIPPDLILAAGMTATFRIAASRS